ncbi:MAG: terminase large subunit domain-containing protein [Methylocystis sp.]|uniref:terminase large subunit domain-containing protein n=1 Tax=Methylocystis sp. TaxID=1911079 RepID=UPI003DA5B6A7
MTALAGVHIDEALDHLELLGSVVRSASWTPWRAFLKAVYGRPLTGEELEVYQACTARQASPLAPVSMVSMVCGRRSGKSAAAAALAVFEACFRDWSPLLGPGEQAVVMTLAATREQAQVIQNYVRGILKASPLLSAMIERETETILELSNRVTIITQPTNFRSVRGRSVAVALLDESAFWSDSDTGSNPDKEVLTAVRASQAQFGAHAKLIMLSSPYRRSGILFEHWNKWHSKDDPRHLSWMAPTQRMNPTVPQDFIDDAFEEDAVAAASEFGSLSEGIAWRSDISSFISREAVEALVAPGRFELPPRPGVHYCAFVDAAGGSGSDSMTLCVAHSRNEVAVIDCLREARPPFSPQAIVDEFCATLRSYGVKRVTGDRWGSEFVQERFKNLGIHYEVSERTKADLYRELLPILNAGRAELLEHKRAVTQIAALERRTARGGRDSIDHPRGGHDDLANCIAGACVEAIVQRGGRMIVTPLRI